MVWDKSSLSLDPLTSSNPDVSVMVVSVIDVVEDFTADPSLQGWERVRDHLSIHGGLSRVEVKLSIAILELQAVHLSLFDWISLLTNHLVQVQSDNATSMASIGLQGKYQECCRCDIERVYPVLSSIMFH